MSSEQWPKDAAQAARHLHGRFREGSISAQAAVRNLTAMGYADAWNLWFDVCDEYAPEAGKRVKKIKNPDGGKRSSRPLPAREAVMSENEVITSSSDEKSKKKGRPPKTNGANGVAVEAAAEKKRGRQSKEPQPPVVMDLFLPRGRSVQIALPGDVSEEDMPIIQEQLDAFMALRAAQRKARGG